MWFVQNSLIFHSLGCLGIRGNNNAHLLCGYENCNVLIAYKALRTAPCWGFPGGAVVENLPANAGDTGSSPGLGRSHMPRSD